MGCNVVLLRNCFRKDRLLINLHIHNYVVMGIFSSHFYPGNTETNCDTETEGKIFSLFMYLPIHSFIVLPSKTK